MPKKSRNSAGIIRSCTLVPAIVAFLGISVAIGCDRGSAKIFSHSAGSQTASDLTWITSSHALYFAIPGRGVFRLQLNSMTPQPLGIHKGASFDYFKMSPSGRYLIYQTSSSSGQSDYLFDIGLGVEQQILGLPPYAHITASPNDRWLAAIPRRLESPMVWLLDLRSKKLKHFAIPSSGGGDVLFGSEWSADSSLLFGEWKNGREVFWQFIPETETFIHVNGVHVGLAKIAYSSDSREFEIVCDQCDTRRTLLTASVAGGTVTVTLDGLVYRKHGAPDRVISSVQPDPGPTPDKPVVACGPEGIHMKAVFDDQYLLFSINQSVELYGFDQKRAAVLPIPPYSELAWQ